MAEPEATTGAARSPTAVVLYHHSPSAASPGATGCLLIPGRDIRLATDGVTAPRQLLDAKDWQLLFLERADVVVLLDEATAAGHCTFKHQGDVYTLDLRYPSLEVCVEALTTKV